MFWYYKIKLTLGSEILVLIRLVLPLAVGDQGGKGCEMS